MLVFATSNNYNKINNMAQGDKPLQDMAHTGEGLQQNL